MTIFVISMSGKPIMPTFNIKKIRKLLKSGDAKIVKYDPFTVRLLRPSGEDVQPIEITEDTGYLHIGLSMKSEKHEYAHEERILLDNEKKKHETCSRGHRKPRRNRKRYRKPRFDNRKKEKGWLAPSLRNKADRHVDLVKRFMAVCPITGVTLEVGTFDIQALKAVEEGKPLPQGEDYQRGPRYGIETLRKAVFARDKYTCIICGRTIKDGAIFHVHHRGFWHGDRSNRMTNLGTVCELCHIPKNHQPGEKLWGLGPGPGFSDAAFMNTVRWYIYEQVKALGIDVHLTYGVTTDEKRKALGLEKTHANDAYAMGSFHPKHRAREVKYKKRRRNDRVLETFLDAKYVDVRDGKTKKAAKLGCNRDNRRVPRDNLRNERKYRGEKKSKGERRIRKKRYPVQSGDMVIAKRYKTVCSGTMSNGTCVLLFSATESPIGKAVTASPKKVTTIYHAGGWTRLSSQD